MTQAPFPDREAVASRLSLASETDHAFLQLLMQTPAQDDALMEGLRLHLEQASSARLLNSLKLEQLGLWLGGEAPSRLQIRLMEVARSSQHPAYAAFRAGLDRSGGLQRAYPTA